MKFQFAFPNPRGKKKRKKSVAKRRKLSKNVGIAHKLKKAVKMAKRRHKKHRRSRKNPLVAYATKGGRRIGQTQTRTKAEIKSALKNDKTIKRLHAQAEKLRKAKRYDEAKALAQRADKLRDLKLSNMRKDRAAFSKDVKTYKADGAEIKLAKTKEKGVAKKRRKKKVKKSSPKRKHAKRKAGKRKHAKRRRKSRKVHAKKHHVKKHSRKRHGKKRHGRRRRRKHAPRLSKMHRHGPSTGHFTHGSTAKVKARKKKGSYRIKAKFGRGKRRVRMSGRARVSKKGILSGVFKLNPFRSNPVNYKSGRSGVEKVTGHDAVELGTMAIAAFIAPYITKTIVPYVSAYVPASVAPYLSALIPIGVGVGANVANDKFSKNGYVQSVADALVAVGVISALYSTGAKSAGLSGINYTPSMGIMPQLNGINYTPSMGIMPQLNGMGAVGNYGDFGAPGDYGGNAGYRQSRADFGADWSEDSEGDIAGATVDDLNGSSMN